MKTVLCAWCAALALISVSFPVLAGDPVAFTPVNHASFVIKAGNEVIHVDPVGAPDVWRALPAPTVILLTDIHQDHLSTALVVRLKRPGMTVIGPAAVIGKLGYGDTLGYGETKRAGGVEVTAVPAYNLTPGRTDFHPPGRGNGYLVTVAGTRIYISGDTEDIPEMRRLKDIDYAFVCMNLPYTMTVEQAASAVLAFKPKVVIPYHYRGKEGMSDLGAFRRLVAADAGIEVRELKWY